MAYLRGDTPFFAERVRVMLAGGQYSTFFNLLAASLIAPLFVRMSTPAAIALWLGGIAAMAVLRVFFVRAFLRTTDPNPVRWAYGSVALSFATGLSWSAFLIFGIDPRVDFAVFCFVLAIHGLSVGNVIYTVWIPAFLAFPLGGVIGQFVFLARLDTAETDLAIVLLAIGYLLLFYVTSTVGRVFMQSIRLRFENLDLIERLRRERDRAEAGARAKSDFLATMSHEIRTPLNGVLGMIQMLLRTDPKPRQREYLETARYSSDALLGLIDDILDFSKAEAGKLELERVDFSPRRLVESVVTLMAARASEKGVALRADYEDAVPPGLRGDPARIRQILLNLASNAIKFTEKGSIVVSIAIVGGALDRPRLRFSVRDTGIGIPPDRQRRLFQAFSQADSSITRRYGGSGLGLAICKRLVEAMGGEIGVDSEVGRGSTFWFDIELPARHEPMQADAARSAPVEPLDILVVDDTPINLQVAVGLLGIGGHRVVAVASGEEAIDRLAIQHFDAVLMDVQMPGIDGFEATRRIRRFADPAKARVPVIAITASAFSDDAARCFASGMNDFVAKPVTFEALDAALRRVRDGQGGRSDGGGEPAALPVFDDSQIRQLARGLKPGVLVELLGDFRTLVGESRERLLDAWQRRDFAGTGAAAHRLSGAAWNMGCLALGDLGRRIEAAAKASLAGEIENAVKTLPGLAAESVAAATKAVLSLDLAKGGAKTAKD